jgi:putative phage-type endonuclease
MPKIISHATKAEWLALRSEDVTSTESAALFGLSPYLTEYELYHRKTKAVTDEFEPNERMSWGLRLQDAIALGVAADLGIRVRRINTYWRHDAEPRMGASFDFEVIDHPDGPGLMEIKNVDYIVYRDSWSDDEAPPHIECQVQHQMEVANRDWCLIVALVAGNTVKTIRRARDREMGAGLRKAVAKFWHKVDKGIVPAPDFTKDADTIRALYGKADGVPLIAKGNNHLHSLALAYSQAAADERDAKARKDAAKAEILTLIGNAPKVVGDGWSLSASTISKAEHVVKPTTYRDFRITQKKTA